MRINEDFLDSKDIELDDVKVDQEETLSVREWNRKYAQEYDQMIVLTRIFVGTGATEDIKKTKILYERVLDMFYPDHAPIQVIYTHDSSYNNLYQAAGAQYEPSQTTSDYLLFYDYKNSVRFKSAIQIGNKPRDIKRFLNFASAMNYLSYKKVGSQNAGGRTEVYVSDGGINFYRPGYETSSISDTILPIYLEEIHNGTKKYNFLSAQDLAYTISKYVEEDEHWLFEIITEWWKSFVTD